MAFVYEPAWGVQAAAHAPNAMLSVTLHEVAPLPAWNEVARVASSPDATLLVPLLEVANIPAYQDQRVGSDPNDQLTVSSVERLDGQGSGRTRKIIEIR